MLVYYRLLFILLNLNLFNYFILCLSNIIVIENEVFQIMII